jgi:hypothetical protein
MLKDGHKQEESKNKQLLNKVMGGRQGADRKMKMNERSDASNRKGHNKNQGYKHIHIEKLSNNH